MATGLLRPAYNRTRRGIESTKPVHAEADEITAADLAALGKACTAFLRSPRRAATPPAPGHWHRPWQPKVRKPLFLLLAQAELRAAIDSGQAKRAGHSTAGWADQVLDGDSPSPKPALE